MLVLLLVCSLFYALYEVFASLAGGRIDEWLAAVLYNGIGTVIPLVVYFAAHAKGKTTTRGIFFATLAGVMIMLFSVFLARIFNKGGNLGYVVPTIYGIAILLSSLFGWLVLKQKVSSLQLVGLGLVLVGVACIVFAKLKNA